MFSMHFPYLVLQVSPESEGVHSSLLSHRCVEGKGVHKAVGGRSRRGGAGRGGAGGVKVKQVKAITLSCDFKTHDIM